MTITIELSKQTERWLKLRAESKGQKIEAVAESIIEHAVPSLAESAAPLREAVRQSGMSEAEVEAFIDDLVREVRAETPLRSR